MFCERCGNQIDDALNFCSKCGERVRKDEIAETAKARSSALDSLTVITIVVGAAGLLFLVGLVAVLVDKMPDSIMGIVGVYMTAWFAIMYRLVSQVIKLANWDLEEQRSPISAYDAPKLASKATAQLENERDVPASVTESTTRDLQKVPAGKL